MEIILLILLIGSLIFIIFALASYSTGIAKENAHNKELLRQAYIALARAGAKIQELENYKNANEIAQKLH